MARLGASGSRLGALRLAAGVTPGAAASVELAGSIGPTGSLALVRSTAESVSAIGFITPSGALTIQHLHLETQAISGSIAPTGNVSVLRIGPEERLDLPIVTIWIDWDHDGFAGPLDNVSDYVDVLTRSRGGSADFNSGISLGSGSLELLNDDGRFTQDNPSSPLFGKIDSGAPVWATAAYGGQQFGILAGYVKDITAVPGDSRVYVTVDDPMARYDRVTTSVEPSQDRTYRDFREAVLDDIGVDASHRVLDDEVDAMHASYAHGEKVLDLFRDLNIATGTRDFIRVGTSEGSWYQYVTRNRQHALTSDVAETVNDAFWMSAYKITSDTVRNEVIVKANGLVFDDGPTVFELDLGRMFIRAGQSRTLWINFNRYLLEPEIIETHTGTASFDLTHFGSTAKIVITATTDAAILAFAISARASVVSAVVSEDVDDASRNRHGLRSVELASDWIVSEAIADGIRDHLLWRFVTPRKRPMLRRYNKFPAMLQREPFDHVAVDYPSLSVSGRRFEIVGDELTIGPDGWYATYQLQEPPSQTPLTFFTVGGSADEGIGGSGVLAY